MRIEVGRSAVHRRWAPIWPDRGWKRSRLGFAAQDASCWPPR